MQNLKSIVCCIILVLSIWSCNNDPTGEHGGIAAYYVHNQSDFDLDIEFLTGPGLGSMIDSSKSVNSNSFILILEDGIIGGDPKPSDSFSSLKLFTSVDTTKKLVFKLDPVDDESWDILDQNLGPSGNDSTTYQLLILNSDLDLD